MRKICVVVNSRANYGRIKSVLHEINKHPGLELQLIVGASALLYRFGNVKEIIENDGFRINATVYSVIEGENPTTMAKSVGIAIVELATLFENFKPDIVITVADRFETIATAISASYKNISVAHTQGGEITGSIDESVRHAITKLSHIHFPATEKASDNIIRMGEDPSTVHMVGCPSIDIVTNIDLGLPPNIFNKYKGVGKALVPDLPYLVVVQHPVTTEYGRGLEQINETLKAVDAVGMQVAWLWPNVDAGSDDISKGLRMYRESKRQGHIHFYRNFEVEDFVRLIANSEGLVGNSSSALREGSFLGLPAVNIGTRQQYREHADNVKFVDYDSRKIEEAIRCQINNGRYQPSYLYGRGNSAEKIAEILYEAKISIQKRLHY